MTGATGETLIETTNDTASETAGRAEHAVPAVGSRVLFDFEGTRRVGTVAGLVGLPGGGFLLRVRLASTGAVAFVLAAQTAPADAIDEFLDAVTGSA